MVSKKTSKKAPAATKAHKKGSTVKPVKATEHKKVEASVDAAVAATKTSSEAAKTVSPKVEKQPVKVKKVYEMSAFFHAVVVLMVVILYAELAALAVIYTNYEVTIESKTLVEMREAQLKAQREVLAKTRKPNRLRIARNLKKAQAAKTNTKVQQVAKALTTQPVAAPTTRLLDLGDFVGALTTQPDAAPVTHEAKPAFKCPEPVARKAQFNEAEYEHYATAGKAVIAGKACFTLADGAEKCFAGVDVFINPVTTYSTEWYERGWAGREFLENSDVRALKYNKKVRTAKDGSYRFENLPAGSYYVGAVVCEPAKKDAKECQITRYAAKVKMKNSVRPTLLKVFP